MLLILNLPLIPMWVQVLKVPHKILFPLILLFCIIGSYSLKNSTFDVLVMMIFGLFGYLFRKFEFEPAPLSLLLFWGQWSKQTFANHSSFPREASLSSLPDLFRRSSSVSRSYCLFFQSSLILPRRKKGMKPQRNMISKRRLRWRERRKRN